jgi:hypothetical protein
VARANKCLHLPEAARENSPLTSIYMQDGIILVSSAKAILYFDLKTLQYSELCPLPEEAFVDNFVWLKDRIVWAGDENKLDGPRRRSAWTFIGRFVFK